MRIDGIGLYLVLEAGDDVSNHATLNTVRLNLYSCIKSLIVKKLIKRINRCNQISWTSNMPIMY